MKPAGPIPSPLNRRWKTYTAAGAVASAAGLVGNAQAAITFVDYNDAVIVDTTIGDPNWTNFNIDFNSDGQNDILLGYQQFDTHGNANVFPAAGATTSVVGFVAYWFSYIYNQPSRLQAPASVGPSAALLAVNGGLVDGRGALAGYGIANQWEAPDGGPPATGYLGVKFKIGAGTHYGWIRLSVAPKGSPAPHFVTIHDAAYETAPDTGIRAGAVPEPGGPGLLALGGAGLMMMRRRKASTV